MRLNNSRRVQGKVKPLFKELVTLVNGKGGLIREEASPGRVVHYALIGMQQHGYVKRNNDGTWVVKK